MAIVIDGTGLTVEKLIRVARHGEQVELSPAAEERIRNCRGMIDRKLATREIMYGVNTGIGEFSETLLNDEEIKLFQKYLVYNHAAGIGDPAPLEYVRGAMVSRVNVHAKGHSAMRLEITQLLINMLNRGVTPFVCQKGSVGACGDLAPMSQIALVVIGEGEAYYNGELLSGKEALKRAGLEPEIFHARDGLATINGSNVLNAMNT
ncbi:MAG: aromatic amino acid lyase, partial [Candidatus Fermentibacteraceae bacterium]|nr:aromatic amino acid lyase [Candidatus Fermentibacteraceae bacterium]